MNIKAVQIHQLSKKHLRQRINREYRYIRFQKVNPSSFHLFQSRYTTKQEKTMQSSELESGLPDEAEQECIVFFLRVGCRELNSNLLLNNLYLKIIKINRIYKIILIKSSFIMSFKISNRGVEPDWFA